MWMYKTLIKFFTTSCFCPPSHQPTSTPNSQHHHAYLCYINSPLAISGRPFLRS